MFYSKRFKLTVFLIASFLLGLGVYGKIHYKGFPPVTKFKAPSKTDFLREGDIVFQSSDYGQGLAIKLATHSKYTHCGILFKKNNQWQVLEAVQPVRYCPLNSWKEHGDNGTYAIRRLKEADKVLTPECLKKMKDEGEKLLGKDYDLYFGWKDDRIYCSELVYKVYDRGAGIKLNTPQTLKELDLSHPAVQAKLNERYGKNLPMEEPMVSPQRVFESSELISINP